MTTQPKAAPLVPEETLERWAWKMITPSNRPGSSKASFRASARSNEVKVSVLLPKLRAFATELLTEECEECGGDGGKRQFQDANDWEIEGWTPCPSPLCGQHGAPKGRVVKVQVALADGVAAGAEGLADAQEDAEEKGAAAERERIVKWLREESKAIDIGEVEETLLEELADELEQEKDQCTIGVPHSDVLPEWRKRLPKEKDR